MIIRKSTVLLYAVNVAILFYVYLDFKNSAIVGNSNSNRTLVYVAIALLAFLSGIYVVTYFFKKVSAMEISLALVFFWIVTDNVLHRDFSWVFVIHLGLSLLWLFLYSFFYRFPQDYPKAYKTARIFLQVLAYVYIGISIYASYIIRNVIQSGTGVLSTSYYVLLFLPVALSAENKYYKYITTLAIIVTVFMSFKRGSIIALFAMICFYIYASGRQKRNSTVLIKLIAAVALLVVIVIVADKAVGGKILERFSSENLQDGSGRSEIYSTALSIFESRGFLYQLTGSGCSSTSRLLGISAHNEWLEFALDYGIIGCVLYANLFVQMIRIAIKKVREGDSGMPLFGCFIVYMAFVGMYGAIYFVQSTIFLFISLGFFSINNNKIDNE